MSGYLCLQGGLELSGAMRELDRRCIELAGGWRVPIAIIPTALVDFNLSIRKVSLKARLWFLRLGAPNLKIVPIVDRDSAESPKNAAALRTAKLIFLLGGSPHYLGQTLRGSACASAMYEAWQNGAVISGSSAGAMILCEQYHNPKDRQLYPGLNYIPNSIVLPHHNAFGRGWVEHLHTLAPTATLLGLDEHTGMINDGGNRWQVFGAAGVHLFQSDKTSRFLRAATFRHPIATD